MVALTSIDREVLTKISTAKTKHSSNDSLKAALPHLRAQDLAKSLQYLVGNRVVVSTPGRSGDILYRVNENFSSGPAADISTLSTEANIVRKAIETFKHNGCSGRSLRAKLLNDNHQVTQPQLKRLLDSLEKQKLIKTFKPVTQMTTIHYIIAHYDPHVSLTGGIWYNNKTDYDESLANTAQELCLRMVRLHTYPRANKGEDPFGPNRPLIAAPDRLLVSARSILIALRDTNAIPDIQLHNVMEIMRALELDGLVERVKALPGKERGPDIVKAKRREEKDDEPGPSKRRRKNDTDSGSDEEIDVDEAAEKERARDKTERARKRRREEQRRKEKKRSGDASEDDDSDALVTMDDVKRKKSKSRKRQRASSSGSESSGSDSGSESESESGSQSSESESSDTSRRKRKSKHKSKSSKSKSSKKSSKGKDKSSRRRKGSVESDDMDGDDNDNGNGGGGGDGDDPDMDRYRRKALARRAAADKEAAGPAGLNDISDTVVSWRAVRPFDLRLGGAAEVPCAKCPVFAFCTEGGPVSASECGYWDGWLAGTAGGWVNETSDRERAEAERKHAAQENERRMRVRQHMRDGLSREDAEDREFGVHYEDVE